MSKCENCIHNEVCGNPSAKLGNIVYGKCNHFKDKSLCIELPCKVGDAVYMPWEWNGRKGVACLKVMSMADVISLGLDFGTNLETDDENFYEEYNCGRFKIDDVGKTVFLTKEEAERKLREVGE